MPTVKSAGSPAPGAPGAMGETQPSLAERVMAEAEVSLQPAHTPTPGRYYQIKKGDTLLAVAGKAYGVGSGNKRLDFARRLNRHPLNARYLREHKATELFPEGVLSFLPEFTCDVRAQVKAEEAVPGGKCFGVIWIPSPADAVHPALGKTEDVPAWLVADMLKGRPAPALSEEEKETEEGASAPGGLTKTELKMVPNTAARPYRFICSVIALFPPPRPDSDPSYHLSGPATGTLIGHRHVLTAGHVLHEEVTIGGVYHGDAATYILKDPLLIVTPGEDSPYKHSGVPKAKYPYLRKALLGNTLVGRFWTHKAKLPPTWTDPALREEAKADATLHLYDYGLIELEQSVGNMKWKTGRFGYWGSEKWGEGTIMTPVPGAEALARKRVYVSGYPDNPVDKEWGDGEDKYHYVERHGVAQWEGAGPVAPTSEITFKTKEDGRERLGYSIPTERGQSGSPVWMTFNSGGKSIRKLLAVHSDGGYGAHASSGVLLTPRVMQDINALKSRPD